MRARRVLLALILASAARPVAAQESSEAIPPGAHRLGPLFVTPAIGVISGMDTNVLNESENPQGDVTATMKPQADVLLRLGRGRLSGKAAFEFVYFRDLASERSINSFETVRFELPINRIRPWVAASFVNTRQRASYEIDARARRLENVWMAGTDVRLAPRMTLALAASRTRVDFDADSGFLGTRLRETLNRHIDQGSASMRYALTPLTTAFLTASLQQDRFDFVPSRDSRSVRITPGVEFAALAFINGKASVGVCRFRTGSIGAPEYTGTVAAVDLGTTIRGVTRLEVRADRDVVFSFDVRTPYYVLTGLGGSITHRFTPAWDATVWMVAQRYDYRVAGEPLPGDEPPTLHAVQSGASIGYWIGRSVRLGINAEYFRRDSQILTLRDTVGFRLTSSVTYGL